MKVVVRAGTKTWFVGNEPPVAEFVQATEVEVEGPTAGGWYVSTEDMPGFPAGARVYLGDKDFDEVPRRGYWEAPGYVWEERPSCSYCTRTATRLTPVDDVLLCDEEACWREFVVQECCSEITFVEEGPDLEEADRVRDEAYDEAYAEDVGPESHAEARCRAKDAAEDAYQKYMEEHDGD